MVVENEIIIKQRRKTKLLETFRSSGQMQTAFAEVNK